MRIDEIPKRVSIAGELEVQGLTSDIARSERGRWNNSQKE